MPASIEDVAKLANVSISTVSRVINRRSLVNEGHVQTGRSGDPRAALSPECICPRADAAQERHRRAWCCPTCTASSIRKSFAGANSQAREMGHNLLLSSALPGDDAESWLSVIGQHALVDGLAVMVSDTMAAGIGPTLAELQHPDRRAGRRDRRCRARRGDHRPAAGALAMMQHLLEDCGAERVFFVGGVRNEHRYAGPLQSLSRRRCARPAQSSTKTTSIIWTTRTNRPIDWRCTRCAIGLGRQPLRICRQRRNGGRHHRRGDRQQCLACRAIWASSVSTTLASPR